MSSSVCHDLTFDPYSADVVTPDSGEASNPLASGAKRVYEAESVDRYIAHLQGELADLGRRLADAHRVAAVAEERAAAVESAEALLGRTLLSAQESAEAAIADAQEQARAIITDAQRQADDLMTEVRSQARDIIDEATGAVEAVFASLARSRGGSAAPVREPERDHSTGPWAAHPGQDERIVDVRDDPAAPGAWQAEMEASGDVLADAAPDAEFDDGAAFGRILSLPRVERGGRPLNPSVRSLGLRPPACRPEPSLPGGPTPSSWAAAPTATDSASITNPIVAPADRPSGVRAADDNWVPPDRLAFTALLATSPGVLSPNRDRLDPEPWQPGSPPSEPSVAWLSSGAPSPALDSPPSPEWSEQRPPRQWQPAREPIEIEDAERQLPLSMLRERWRFARSGLAAFDDGLLSRRDHLESLANGSYVDELRAPPEEGTF